VVDEVSVGEDAGDVRAGGDLDVAAVVQVELPLKSSVRGSWPMAKNGPVASRSRVASVKTSRRTTPAAVLAVRPGLELPPCPARSTERPARAYFPKIY
jgi:hypothetical protein